MAIRRRSAVISRRSEIGRQAFGADEIVEFGRLRLEMQLDRADGPMALLGDDDVGGAFNGLGPFPPAEQSVIEFLVAFLRAAARLAAREVVLLAEDEHHNIGTLLD